MPLKLSTVAASLLLTLVAAPARAQAAPASAAPPGGGLLLAPTRLVFEGKARSAVITLNNTGAKPATYRISFTEMKMDEQGTLRPVAPGEAVMQSAEPLVRYSPRQVTLEPGVSQTVRLLLRKPAELAPGEYRSHLAFRAVPVATEAAAGAAQAGAEEKLSVQVTTVYGVSIPVIVRQGNTSATATLSEPRVQRKANGSPEAVIVKLGRQGNQSLFGDMSVTWVPADGRAVPAGSLNGVAIYTSAASRPVRIPLAPSFAASAPGRLRVAFTDPVSGALLAATEAQFP